MARPRTEQSSREPKTPGKLAAMSVHLAERCPLPVLVTVGDAHIVVFANSAMGRLAGRPALDLIGRPAAEALPGPAGASRLAALMDQAYATGVAASAVSGEPSELSGQPAQPRVVVWPTSHDESRPAGLVVLVVGHSDAPLLDTAPDRDAPSMWEVNQALLISSVEQHQLAEAARNAEEAMRKTEGEGQAAAVLEERNRMAREIHDTLAQAFTGILLQTRVAQRIAEQRPEEAWRLVAGVSDLAQEGLAEARRSVWALQPVSLQFGDLATALSQTVEKIASSSGAEIEMHVSGTPRELAPDVGLDLLRVGQEALTNALRHGRAQMIYVEIEFTAEKVRLRVQDDGVGFDPAQPADRGGFGLVGMAQRAERLGGRLTIVSQPGRGTEVSISAPLPAPEREDHAAAG